MRLIEFGQKENYQPLERGHAFPQFYENGDSYKWWSPMDFNNHYWINFVQWADLEFGFRTPDGIIAESLMMGGEL